MTFSIDVINPAFYPRLLQLCYNSITNLQKVKPKMRFYLIGIFLHIFLPGRHTAALISKYGSESACCVFATYAANLQNIDLSISAQFLNQPCAPETGPTSFKKPLFIRILSFFPSPPFFLHKILYKNADTLQYALVYPPRSQYRRHRRPLVQCQ